MISSSVATVSGVRVLLDGPRRSGLFDTGGTFRVPLHQRRGRSCLVIMCILSTPAVLPIVAPLLNQRCTRTMDVQGAASHLGLAESGSEDEIALMAQWVRYLARYLV